MLLSFATRCLITWRFFTIVNGYTAPWPIKRRLNLKMPITDSRGGTTRLLSLTAVPKNPICLCPVKQKRALLKSNPPRDNWIEGDEINRLYIWGAKNSPNANPETFISEPSHALKNFEHTIGPDLDTTKQIDKNTLSRCPFFRSKPTLVATGVHWFNGRLRFVLEST